jgi:hypothetical protein
LVKNIGALAGGKYLLPEQTQQVATTIIHRMYALVQK